MCIEINSDFYVSVSVYRSVAYCRSTWVSWIAGRELDGGREDVKPTYLAYFNFSKKSVRWTHFKHQLCILFRGYLVDVAKCIGPITAVWNVLHFSLTVEHCINQSRRHYYILTVDFSPKLRPHMTKCHGRSTHCKHLFYSVRINVSFIKMLCYLCS